MVLVDHWTGERVWRFSGNGSRYGRHVGDGTLQPLPDLALRAMGVDASAKAQIQDVYGAYNRNNRPNLLFVSVLQRLLRGAASKQEYEPQRTNLGTAGDRASAGSDGSGG